MYVLLYCTVSFLFISYPNLLTCVSRIYQRGYRCWNFNYAGLGEERFVYKFTKESRLLCKKDLYSQEFERVLLDLKNHLTLNGRVLQYYPGLRTTYLLELDGISYIVKKSSKRPLLESLFYPCRYSRNAWNNAERACQQSFKTYEPIALIEFGRHLRFTSYLVYPLEGVVLEEKKGDLEGWIELFKRALKQQKNLKILHPDFHCKNLVQLKDGSIRYIDIDDLHWYGPFSYLYHVRFSKELKRFGQDFSPPLFIKNGNSYTETD